SFKEGEYSRIFDTTDFGYRKITIERPLQLNFQASPERIERLNTQKAFTDLATSKKKKTQEKLFEESAGQEQQQAILTMLKTLPGTMFKDRPIFEKELDKTTMRSGLRLTPPLRSQNRCPNF